MTDQATIEQMNRAIFDFMGCVHSKHSDMDAWEMSKLKYHESWNELMPVVEKINTLRVREKGTNDLLIGSKISVSMGVCGHFRDAHCIINGTIYYFGKEFKADTIEMPMISVHRKKRLIEAVYEAICQFIQWYNQLPIQPPQVNE